MGRASPSRLGALLAAAVVLSTTLAAHAVELTQVTRPHDRGYLVIDSYYEPTWSATGDTLVAAVRGYSEVTREAFGFNVGFDLEGNLLDWPNGLGGWYVARPSLSPNQQRMAMECHINLVCAGVAVLNTTVEPGTSVFDDLICLWWPRGAAPAWSPDGSQIVVGTENGLYVYTPTDKDGDGGHDGGGEYLTTGPEDWVAAWSPDATRVVFSSMRNGNRDLWVLDVATREERRLTAHPAEDTWPAWSPNGHWIAFSSERAGSSDIWAIPATGGDALLIAHLPTDSSAPAWSPDGKSIAFSSGAQIWVARELPDVILPVSPTSWTNLKSMYRRGGR